MPARISWEELPAGVRRAVEALNGPVLSAFTVADGLNSAVATVIETSHARSFLKGLPVDHGRAIAQQREAAINPFVRAVSPVLRWRLEIEGWDLLCFERADGRAASYAPGSSDLPLLIDAMRLVAEAPCPELPPAYFRPAEQRYSAWIDDPTAREALMGETILHTDYNPSNVLVTSTRAQIVDWAWPTKGAAWIDPACLIPRLIAAGHSPAAAEDVAKQSPAFADADPAAVDLFTGVLASNWSEVDRNEPGVAWIEALAASAGSWHELRRE